MVAIDLSLHSPIYTDCYLILHSDNKGILSSTAVLKVNHTLDHTWAKSTLSKYHNTVNQFLSFSANTVQSHLTAIKAWHTIMTNAGWVVSISTLFSMALQTLPHPLLKKTPRPPITHSMLLLLANHLDVMSPFDNCCFTAACFAMLAQSHLLPPFNLNSSCKCHLPFTKVAKSPGEDIVICRQCGSSDPIATVENHLLVNAIPPNLPLFSFLSPHGWQYFTKKKLLTCCNSIWSLAGISSATGHSFHISGTAELLLAGVPPNVVKALGRWLLDAFLHYWCSLELLAPIHSKNLIPHSS
ncbi:hypothetical protein PAXINDRAFT_164085 [Paxillus involutus ATCC 200175]|uniref:Uncharacterized protein n=1 Tax=Paxillus involutus ATCC 200175 TaxID=664439 RepID=A0A0C9TW76_PAXIN|nr:hypothetical protein PAXINDRAFT_164085 [Paxillus involutus ATCC 200175]